MNHLPLLVIVIFVLSILLLMIFRLFRSSPRDKARVVVTYAQRRGYVLLNPSFAQALDTSRLEMMKDPVLRNSLMASTDIADIEGLNGGTGDWLAFTCNLGSKDVTIFNLSVNSQRADR